ncbi:MAG: hypothetical protein ABJB61_06125, partial [bacterium]
MNSLRTLAALILALLFVSDAIAHDTWLIPERFSIPTNSIVLLNLTSGMAFPALETSIKSDRVDRAHYRLAGQTFVLSDISSGPRSLRFQALLSAAGIATFWVELKPRLLELTPKQVQEYLEEIDASPIVRQQWAAAEEPRR